MTGSVDSHVQFVRRLQHNLAARNERVEVAALELGSRILVGDAEQSPEEVLLLAAARAEFGREHLLHAEPRLVLATSGFVAVEIRHCAEGVEQSLAAIARATFEQIGQTANRVESAGADALVLVGNPTSEQCASLGDLHGELVRDFQRLLELGVDANEIVNRLFHVLDLGHHVLAVPDLETEFARIVAHHDGEGVRAHNARRGVDSVQVGALIDAVEQAEAVLETALSDLVFVHIRSQLHGDEATATVEQGACGFDDRAGTAHAVVHDFPEPLVRDSGVGVGNGDASGLAVVGAAEVSPALQRGIVANQQRLAFDFVGESVGKFDDRLDDSAAVPSHFETNVNVADRSVTSHSSEK